jgi:hypothetical protein
MTHIALWLRERIITFVHCDQRPRGCRVNDYMLLRSGGSERPPTATETLPSYVCAREALAFAFNFLNKSTHVHVWSPRTWSGVECDCVLFSATRDASVNEHTIDMLARHALSAGAERARSAFHRQIACAALTQSLRRRGLCMVDARFWLATKHEHVPCEAHEDAHSESECEDSESEASSLSSEVDSL